MQPFSAFGSAVFASYKDISEPFRFVFLIAFFNLLHYLLTNGWMMV